MRVTEGIMLTKLTKLIRLKRVVQDKLVTTKLPIKQIHSTFLGLNSKLFIKSA
jgi:hypothetical protein